MAAEKVTQIATGGTEMAHSMAHNIGHSMDHKMGHIIGHSSSANSLLHDGGLSRAV